MVNIIIGEIISIRACDYSQTVFYCPATTVVAVSFP